MQKYLWWKKYITQIQIIQFVFLFAYGVFFYFFQQGYASFYTYNMLIQSVIYMVLFSRFYLRTYRKSPQQKLVKDDNNNDKLSIKEKTKEQ